MYAIIYKETSRDQWKIHERLFKTKHAVEAKMISMQRNKDFYRIETIYFDIKD